MHRAGVMMNAERMPQMAEVSSRIRKDRRRRIGLLLVRPDIEGHIMQGVTSAALGADIEVICFGGGYLAHRGPSHAVYSLANEVPLDGIIVCTALGTGLLEDEIRAFCARFAGIPIVTGALGLAEYPSVATESFPGVYDVVTHLIEVHDCRRIAYIEGPAGQSEATERFEAYRAALRDQSIPFESELVVPGDYSPEGGAAGMRMLFKRFWSDDRGLDLDAVVTVNDESAVGAHQVLTGRGVQLPQDVALVGFDDAEEGWSLVPSLTTVRQSREAVGQKAVSIMLRLLEGGTSPDPGTDPTPGTDPDPTAISGLQRVPSEVVIRRSCGCMPLAVTRAVALSEELVADGTLTCEGEPSAESALWLALLHTIGARSDNLDSDAVGSPVDFLVTVDGQLRELYARSGDSDAFQDRLSLLRRHLLAPKPSPVAGATALSPAQLIQAEDLLHQARILTGDIGRRIEAARARSEIRRSEMLHKLDTELSSVVDLPGLARPLEAFLSESLIRELYVVVQDQEGYDEDRGSVLTPTSRATGSDDLNLPEFARQRRLILRYSDGRAEISDIAFAAPNLLPDLVQGPTSPVIVTLPLVFRDRLLGYMVISHSEQGPAPAGETENSRNAVYQRIAEELSSVLYRLQLLVEAGTARREAEVSLAEIRRTREIADRVRRAPDAEAILRVALEELSGVLDAPRAVARLGTQAFALTDIAPAPDREADDANDA